MRVKRTLSFALVCCVGLTSTTAAIAQASPKLTFDKEAAAHNWWDLYFKDSQSVELADGRTINLMCEGQGSPVVILDAGMGSGAWTWRHVHVELARTTRVCAYDRSGYGQSSRSKSERSAGAQADELAQLLERAALPPPYILVGRSYAAFIDRLYAHRHLNKVAALILVEFIHRIPVHALCIGAPGRGREGCQSADACQGVPEVRANRHALQSVSGPAAPRSSSITRRLVAAAGARAR